ncbi:MAG: serine/threonine protein kinase [Phycisphaeraceae bacterium]|nr:serine/threonine protein kinase [Phycisphaeraceae bacterium]
MTSFEPAKPGTKLAGFSVIAEIGRGAASVVYLVQDPKSKQIYALKQVQKHGPKDQRFLDQAESEYQVSVKVKHPVIRKMHDIIKSRALLQVKELFLVMEYVDGVAIDKHPPKSIEQALAIFSQVARGLAAMHRAGYVHADMKPNNVVVCDNGDIKIIDLGQACPLGAVKERIQGTPDYIAPEQVHRREITERTDVYNLGATLYWVLTGKNIPTAIPKSDSLVSSLDDNLIERPRPIREVAPQVPEQLADLVMQCVEVNPANRPQSMEVVADKLDFMLAKLRAEKQRLKAGSGVAMQALAREGHTTFGANGADAGSTQ